MMRGPRRFFSVAGGCGLTRLETCQGARETCQGPQTTCHGEVVHGWYPSTSRLVPSRGRVWHACVGSCHGVWHAKNCRQFNGVTPDTSLFDNPHETNNRSIQLTQKRIVYSGELENTRDRRVKLPSRSRYPAPGPDRFPPPTMPPTMPSTATAPDCHRNRAAPLRQPPRPTGEGCASAPQLGRSQPLSNGLPSR